MTPFDLAAVFLAVIGAVGWLNVRFMRLPNATVMVLAGLLAAGLLLLLHGVLPGDKSVGGLIDELRRLDFPRTVLGYMLAFLLFAGAMQVDMAELKRRAGSVWTLATLGVLASTAIVGSGLWFAAKLLGLPLTLPWALVFGSLISPTDPIAVLAAVRHGKLSKRVEAILQGEALFNDGFGIVVFTAAVAIASGGHEVSPLTTIFEVGIEAGGGFAIGLVLGVLVIRAMRAIDEYAVDVALSLALATGAYSLAQALHVSGPIAVVVAGLMIGDRAAKSAMSEATQTYVRGFWTLIDEILNALLFLLLGLEVIIIPFELRAAGLWAVGIVLVLLARFAVVLPWGAYFHIREKEQGVSTLLAWGGLHGALSLALALSLPKEGPRELILSVTFAVVMFSVVVQGMTFAPLSVRIDRRKHRSWPWPLGRRR